MRMELLLLEWVFEGVDKVLKRDYFLHVQLVDIILSWRIEFAQRANEPSLRAAMTEADEVQFLIGMLGAVAIAE